MKKRIVSLALAILLAGGLCAGVFAQTSDCLGCNIEKCQEDSEWLGAITNIEATEWDVQGRATAVDLFLELRPGWNGKNEDGDCCVSQMVTQSCVQFDIRRFEFASNITGWGWDFNDNRVIDEYERMSFNETYWSEFLTLPSGNLQVIIHSIPLDNGVLLGNVYLTTEHGEINYFIPPLLKHCDEYSIRDGYGANLIYAKFW